VNEQADSFPRQYARTRRFTLGHPRSFSIAADGSRVAFLRSPAGDDPETCLWVLGVDTGRERLIADPRALLATGQEDLPAAERARRERTRESAAGIVAYAGDRDLRVAAFALSGRLFLVDLVEGAVHELPSAGPAFDPRPDPGGSRVAYVTDGALHLVDVGSGQDSLLAADEDPDVTWGVAEFVAAEEMDRSRGYWWAPDGSAVAVARVDNRPVAEWHIANPAEPEAEPVTVRYPAAGTENAVVDLWILGLDGSRTKLAWDRDAFPYLVEGTWQRNRPLTLLVQSRDQRRSLVLTADAATGATRTLREDHDPIWLEIIPGIPGWTDQGALVFAEDRVDTRCLVIDGEPVTPAGLQVRQVVETGEGVVFTASTEPMEVHVWRVSPSGQLSRITGEPGVHGAVASGRVMVTTSATMDRSGFLARVHRDGTPLWTVVSNAEAPLIEPSVSFVRSGPGALRSALLLPADRTNGPLPVLLDPYGGPSVQRVVSARDAYLQSQWFADQGFAVLVTDGRGTPGRGAAWERAVHLDLAGPVLEDQVEALHAVAADHPEMDLSRVGIRGWSFGGYLAALAVLRRPDVFHAAVAGAPVTDWRIYDTHYTERYLGHPEEHPEAYERSSLIADAPKLERPLLLIHGLADDNVVAAHTLRLSRALLEAGRPHQVLPLSGVTHMTPQEVVAENLLLLQVAFLRQALAYR